MSMTGSLLSYENNCDSNRNRSKPRVTVTPSGTASATAASSAAAAAAAAAATTATVPSSALSAWSARNSKKIHLNHLWSVWYGLCLTGFQAYLAMQCAKRFIGYASLPWPAQPPPRLEMNACLAFLAVSVIALPFFFLAAVFKVGNLANDGFKLGRNLSTCTADPPTVLLGSSENQGVFRSLWQHGGPTSAFLHLTAALCFLLPKLIMEARLIQSGFLPRDSVWKTDLDFAMTHQDRLIVLNFMTSPPPYSNVTTSVTPHSATAASEAEELTSVPVNRGPKDLMISSFVEDSVLGSISPEFLNYMLALMVYAVRYPSVFWNTNKCFGTLFSFQLLANGIQSVLSFTGVSVLYKVQIVGVLDALPLLKKTSFLGSPFLLDAYFTLGLFVLSSILVLSTSLVLYLYGYGRFNAFLNTERERKVIVLRENKAGNGGWGYFTHCAALSVLIALAVCHAPLLHDCTVLYRGSLDSAILACVAAAILHLFLWVLIWLVLTVKQKWIFQLRVTIGRAAVRSARSVKLVTDVDLVSCSRHGDEVTAPLLVVGNGRTYTIGDASPKRAIYNIIQKAAIDRRTRLNATGSCNDSSNDDDTEIYWLRPKPRSPKGSPSDSDRLNWFNKKLNSSQKHKVTFDDSLTRGETGESKKRTRIEMNNSASICDDDGDYATLRMGPPGGNARTEDNISEENKLLEHALRDDNVTFARSSDLQPDYEDPSPLLTPEPNELPLPPPPPPDSNHAVVATVQNTVIPTEKVMAATPKCLRRADSGMPHEDITPRSGSVSSGSQSGSGGSPPGVQNSESSSGVHSNASSRRATSVDDLTVQQEPRQLPWKSCSLQRNILPPNAPGSQQIYNFGQHPDQMVPSVILENPCEDTVVIRRKSSRPLTADLSRPPEIKEEPFGRSTNMRMTSFTDEGNSATLPHFPTQPPPPTLIYSCNTMPLPCPPCSSSASPLPPPPVVPVQPITFNGGYPRPHTTLPIHHNGVRLFPAPAYAAKKFHYGISAGLTRFPKHNRDSANFSMASSGESDVHS